MPGSVGRCQRRALHVNVHAGIRRIFCYRRRALYSIYGVRIGTCFFVSTVLTPLQMLLRLQSAQLTTA